MFQKSAKIMVIGLGGAGSNCITKLTEMGVKGAKTVAVNTDAKHLQITKADRRILIGKETTKGLGAGGFPEMGRKAAEEDKNTFKEMLKDVDMVFLVTGLGGGTGTGSTPVVAEIAKSMGIIVIGTVTMPFKVEGARIMKAEDSLALLRQVCDTVIVIENDKLLQIAGNLPLAKAFAVADELISSMIQGITETITEPSLVNLDFADVKAIMHSGGVAAIGIGKSSSDKRAAEAVQRALTNPLLQVDYKGATGALIHISGGEDLKLEEINEIGEFVSQHLDPMAQVIWGARVNPMNDGKIQVITVITGVKSPYILGPVQRMDVPERAVSRELGIDIMKF
jgi:cell division protein FtsZ